MTSATSSPDEPPADEFADEDEVLATPATPGANALPTDDPEDGVGDGS